MYTLMIVLALGLLGIGALTILRRRTETAKVPVKVREDNNWHE